MPTIDTCQLLVTPDGLKVCLQLSGVEWEIKLEPDQAEALADRLREVAVKVRRPQLTQESELVAELFEVER